MHLAAHIGILAGIAYSSSFFNFLSHASDCPNTRYPRRQWPSLLGVCVCVDMIKTAAAIITNERIADRRSCFSEVFAGLEKEGKERKQETTGKKKDFDSCESVGLIRRVNVGINNHKVIIK